MFEWTIQYLMLLVHSCPNSGKRVEKKMAAWEACFLNIYYDLCVISKHFDIIDVFCLTIWNIRLRQAKYKHVQKQIKSIPKEENANDMDGFVTSTIFLAETKY